LIRFDPHSYQRAIARFLIENVGGAIFADPGTGKTASTLSAWRAMLMLGLGRRALVIAPKRVAVSTWPDELAKWSQFVGLKAELALGTPSQRLRAIKRGAPLTITTPDTVPWLSRLVTAKTWDTLFVDESTKFKSSSAKRFKLLKKLLPKFDRRYILTGTPTPQSLIDLWAQFFIIDSGATLGKSLTEFHRRYCYKGGFKGREWILHTDARAEIERLIAPLSIRVDRADFLDMPDLQINDVWLDLPPDLLKAYKTLERDLFAMLASGDNLTVDSAGAKYLTCRQFANGGFYVTEGDEDRRVEHVHNLKAEAARDIVEDLQGKPVLIAFQFRHDLERLRKVVGDYPALDGSTSALLSARLVKDWNRKALPVLYCQPQAMSHGLNLQKGGNDVIWVGLTDNQETYQQTNERVYRQGIEGQVRIHRILCRKTVDEAVRLNIETKSTNQKALLDALNTYRSEARFR
jgi:SNF2 family DNA or RNA helicase